MEENKSKKYAGQIADIVRSDKRLSFTDLLQKIEDRHDTPYLNVFAPQSIYLATLFTFSEQESVTANIPLKDIPLIARKTDFAEELIFQLSSNVIPSVETTEKTEEPEPAFMPLRIGKWAGQAPGDILLESSNPKETMAALKSQMSFLEKGAQKYPNNRQDMNAIAQALDYYAMGILRSCKPETTKQAAAPSTSKTYTIYETPTKHQKRMENGKNLCYSVKITCSPAKKYPYRFEIMNCWAPLGQAKNGMKPILMDQALDVKRKDIDLTEEEWLYTIDTMTNNLAETRHLWYPEMRACDSRNRWQNQGRNW